MKKSAKRFYAFKEYVIVDDEQLVFFVGLTDSISRGSNNGYSRLHRNIPSWCAATDVLVEALGLTEHPKPYQQLNIKRSYHKYFSNYRFAKQRYVQLIKEYQPLGTFNFIECIEGYDKCKYDVGDANTLQFNSTDFGASPTPLDPIKKLNAIQDVNNCELDLMLSEANSTDSHKEVIKHLENLELFQPTLWKL